MAVGYGTIGSRRRVPRRRGAAMVEFVLALPLLAILIGLTFFFGWAMRNQQGVIVSARYAAWGGGTDSSSLNAMFMDDKAGGVTVSTSTGPDQTRQELLEQAGTFGADAYRLAYEALYGAEPLGAGVSATVSAGFPTNVAMWRRFEGDIVKQHACDRAPWRRGQGQVLSAIRSQFLTDLDQQLQQVPPEAQPLAETIRRLYTDPW